MWLFVPNVAKRAVSATFTPFRSPINCLLRNSSCHEYVG